MDEDRVYIVIYNRSDDYGFGAPLRVICETNKRDAIRFCSDQRTRGRNFFCGWTHKNGQKIVHEDDGRFDDVFQELGIERKNPLEN